LLLIAAQISFSQDLPEVRLDEAWREKIRALAPEKTTFPFSKKKKALVFSLHTGFNHWVRPHTEEMIKILAEKSGAFTVTGSKNIEDFEWKNLKKYDVLVLNNNSSKPDYRNLFWDQLSNESQADSTSIMRHALQLEENLIRFVREGGGLLVLHGANTLLNNSMKFSRLLGGSFDYHPPQQAFQVRLKNPNHPLVQAFSPEGFNHVDEPYFYKNAYEAGDFTPLLYFNNSEITGQRKDQEKNEGKTYVAWIRAEGKGKVLYAAPSHNAQSFENPQLLQFFLDGLQYVAGDVECDESPIGKIKP
jgi:type 1 glutamine amidotransferase